MRRNLLILTALISGLIAAAPAVSCTRVLYAEQGQPTMVGRTMDWYSDLDTSLIVFPAGLARDGMGSVNSLQWTSKYGSIVTSSYDLITTDGMNEQGLAAHMLWLDATDYGKRNADLPGLSVAMWAQFYLDSFKSVSEALQYTQEHPFQMEPFSDDNQENMVIHLAIDDASGDSAILEYIDGKLHIYHDRAYKVLTNDPTYDQQLENLKQYAGFGGDKPLPGTTDPKDRFVRSTYYVNHLPTPTSTRAEVAAVLSIVHNASEPYSDIYASLPDYDPTVWRVLADLSHLKYYFNDVNSFNTTYTQLDKLNLKPGAPVLRLDILHHSELAGDVTGQFVPFELKNKSLR